MIKVNNNPIINANSLQNLENKNDEDNKIELNEDYLKIFIKLFYFIDKLKPATKYK